MSEVERTIDCLKGETFIAINVDKENQLIKFTTENNEWYIMKHSQDCCERVYIESIVGDINDLIGSPILLAQENTNHDGKNATCYSATWTFYMLATIKGYVDIRWCGESNGYYSESVEIYQLKDNY